MNEIYDLDENLLDPSTIDPAKGRITITTRVKPNAISPDGKEKIAYSDDDYETVAIYTPYRDSEYFEKRVEAAKKNLCDTDYISAKMADKLMSCSSSEEVDEVLSSFNAEYADIFEQRQQWRDEINDLEAQLADLPPTD